MNVESILFATLDGACGSIGLITLNRPAQLNALTHAMTVAIRTQLIAWAHDDAIKAVVIRGAGDKAFCAGGDIRSIYMAQQTPANNQAFFIDEYRLNQTIYHFPKPYIALMHGLNMGGGVGVSVNGQYRVATEALKLAMPETGIGFFTDVGASYFLSRCPGKIGWYLGLTGRVINAQDAQHIGLVDTVIPSIALDELLEKLVQISWTDNSKADVAALLNTFSAPKGASTLWEQRAIIDDCFAKPSIEQILMALDNRHDAWSIETAQLLRSRSPLSLKVVLEQLNRGAQLNFDDCMRMEYRLASRFVSITGNFYEGIRAVLIDKDRAPHWQPACLTEVSAGEVASYFAPLIEQEELSFL